MAGHVQEALVSAYSGEEVPKPAVVRQCKVCGNAWWAKGRPWTGIVSPRRVEHIGLNDGLTVCGKDATGDKWWWPL